MAYFPAVLVFNAFVSIVLAGDENTLLQTEMLVQSSDSKVEMDDFTTDNIDKTEGETICQDFSDRSISGIPQNLETVAQDIIPETTEMPAAEVGHDVMNGQAPLQEKHMGATSYVFGWCLDILVLVIIVDGIRRWRYKNVSGPDKSCDADDWRTFMQAALIGDTTNCEALLTSNIDIARTDKWGCTLLHGAAKGGRMQIVNQLLECGSRVDECDLWGEMPLHIAARAGHVDICERLIEHGTPINAQNAENWTPLVIAANEGRELTCKLLLMHGATVGDMMDSELPRLLTGLLKEEEFPSLLWKLDEQDDQEDDIDAVQQRTTA